VTPGLRYERIEVVRTDYAGSDPERISPTGVRTNELDVVIPGVGVMFDATPELSIFGGVHKGFAPPGPGSTEETEAESSVNYELGFRSRPGALRTQLVGFFNDYDNLLGRDTLSTGGGGSGTLFNGGEARIYGLEASLDYETAPLGRLGVTVPLRTAYTWTRAEFGNSFESGFGPWGDVTSGDVLPYVPEHQLYASVGVARSRWNVVLDSSYVSTMRIRAGSGPIARLDSTDSRIVLNTTAEYSVGEGARLFVAAQNLGNSEYVVARHPAGARPGLPRTITGGVRFDLEFR
jgi:Fe(3+) dicitrate transport protein